MAAALSRADTIGPQVRELFVGNHAFTAYFHEYGYYSGRGGSRPKLMLLRAVLWLRGRLGLL